MLCSMARTEPWSASTATCLFWIHLLERFVLKFHLIQLVASYHKAFTVKDLLSKVELTVDHGPIQVLVVREPVVGQEVQEEQEVDQVRVSKFQFGTARQW